MPYRLFDFIIVSIFIVIQISIYTRLVKYLRGLKNIDHSTIIQYSYYVFFTYNLLSIFLIPIHQYFIYLSHILNLLFVIGTLYIIDKLPHSIDREILFVMAIIYILIYVLLLSHYLFISTGANTMRFYPF